VGSLNREGRSLVPCVGSPARRPSPGLDSGEARRLPAALMDEPVPAWLVGLRAELASLPPLRRAPRAPTTVDHTRFQAELAVIDKAKALGIPAEEWLALARRPQLPTGASWRPWPRARPSEPSMRWRGEFTRGRVALDRGPSRQAHAHAASHQAGGALQGKARAAAGDAGVGCLRADRFRAAPSRGDPRARGRAAAQYHRRSPPPRGSFRGRLEAGTRAPLRSASYRPPEGLR